MRPEDRKLLDKCLALPAASNIELYSEFLVESPDWAVIPASALRVQAREGKLHPALIPILFICLTEAQDLGSVSHLSKALAAFGREAGFASAEVVRRAESIHVTDDAYFWIFDALLWVLGYLGGEQAAAYVERLSNESPLKVNASDSVFSGKLTSEKRQAQGRETLTRVAEMIAKEDAGRWDRKLTDLKVVDDDALKEPKKTLAPWMTR